MTIILMYMLKEVLMSIFSEWLEVLDIGNLDSAMCNPTQRSSFLNLISNKFFIHNGSTSIDNKFLFSWISLRKMKVKNVHLRHCGQVTTSILNILKTSKNFSKLAFNSKFAVVIAEQHIEIQTKSLELTVFDDNEKNSVELSDRDFEHLLTRITGLQTLDIIECSSLTNKAFHSITQNCPMLTDIAVRFEDGLLNSYSLYILCNGCKRLTNVNIDGLEDDIALEYIAQYAPQVTHLKLYYVADMLEDNECRLVRVAEHGNIEHLDLFYCNENSLLETIRLSPRLKYLSVDYDTMMTDETMTAIANTCPLLTHLNISSNTTSGFVYTDVGVCAVATKCRQLKVLKLSSAYHITDISVLCIAQHCLDLTEIEILYNSLCSNDAMQILLNGLVHLKLFYFFRDNEQFKMDDILVRLTKDVAHLTLGNKKFAKLYRNCDCSSRKKEIRCWVDSRSSFSLNSLQVIAQHSATTLQHISLTDFFELCDDHMLTVFSNCPLINSVILSNLPALTEKTIEIMTQYCPLLDSLEMRFTIISLDDNALMSLLVDKPHFKSLQLRGIYCKLTDATIYHIAAHCRNIRTFEISSNKNITDSSVCNMIKYCVKLCVLSLDECTNITSKVLIAIAMYSHTLRSLDIEGCEKIENREIVQFLQAYTELTEDLRY